jgi:NAD+ kinase
MKTIGLAPNPHKADATHLAGELATWLESRGVVPLMSPEAAVGADRADLAADDEQLARTDLLVILGGDGTMLRWSRLAAPHGTPMLGVNFGHYGFITEIEPEVVRSSLERVLAGDFTISERVVLHAVVIRNDKPVATYYALNDVVISKGPFARMVSLHTLVNGQFIVTYAADGIIISSPTGSTAYSLSAGGPVVHPDVSVLIITPVCPHTLNVRSLVVPDAEKIQIVGQCSDGESELMLTLDGQLGEHLGCSDTVEIGKAEFTARLVQFDPHSFYDKLQTRMRWGERYNT